MTYLKHKLRAVPRAVFALIPLGFVAMVGIFLWLGQSTGGPVAAPEDRIDTDPMAASSSPIGNIDQTVDPDGVGAPVYPSPSGPEYGDNAVIFEK